MASTSAREWKKKSRTGNAELTLPSGNQCLVRQLAPEAFLNSGVIPDSLSAIVNKAIKSKKGLPPDVAKAMTNDPKQLMQGLKMIDQVLCYVVIEPTVIMPPACIVPVGESLCGQYETDDVHNAKEHDNYHVMASMDRDKDVLYADEVDLEDKNFIFQFVVGGTADVERFRKDLSAGMANVSDGKAVPGKAKRTSRRK